MSALFRAEIDNLQRLVRMAALNQEQAATEKQHTAELVRTRVERLQAVNGRMAKSNRSAIVAALKRFARPHAPISANKVGELTGITDDTTRKHLSDMAAAGEVVAVVSPSGKQTRYHLPQKGTE